MLSHRFRYRLAVLLTALGTLQAASAQAVAQETFATSHGVPLEPNGTLANSGWALGRLNDGADLSRTTYVYSETAFPVRLYLIDSGVTNDSGWFDGNTNLTLLPSTAIRGSEDPTAITAFEHGTRMLSVIAGPETGAAQGTPIEVVSYDIYPGGEGSTTTTTLLADAISEARLHHITHSGTPGVICVALGSTVQEEDPLLEATIDSAVSAGLTVVVSAGNQGGEASSYIPSAYGTKSGVICVGASNSSNQILLGTNYGSAVDFYAPGEAVRTLDYDNPQPGAYEEINGTSPAAGLATAAVLVELSKNPGLSPADVESTLLSTVYSTSINLLQVQPPTDADSDGVDDVLEQFFGTDPDNPADYPAQPGLTRTPSGVSLSFPIASSLFDPAAPYTLTDNSTWRVLCSSNLSEWTEATGTLVPGSPTGDTVPVTFSMDTTAASCFLKVEVTPAP